MNEEMVSLFRRLTLGVYVIGVAHDEERDAFTAAAVMQVSYRPLILAIAINPEHASYPILTAGRSFAISVLGQGRLDLARRFGTTAPQGTDKMQGVAWRTARRGAPFLSEALAFFECAVQAEMPAGDHCIVLGQVLGGAILHSNGTPMKYGDTHDLDHSAALYPEHF